MFKRLTTKQEDAILFMAPPPEVVYGRRPLTNHLIFLSIHYLALFLSSGIIKTLLTMNTAG